MSVKLTAYVWDGCAPSGMKITSVAIMARLADFSSDEGVSWPSIATIARQIGAGPSTVRAAIRKLESDGWLKSTARRKGNRNTSNMYQLNVKMLRDMAISHAPESDTSNSDASNTDASKTGATVSDASKSGAPDYAQNGSFHPPESGDDPSVNSTNDPTDKKPCQVASQPDDIEPAKIVLEHFNQKTNSSYRDGKTTMGFIRGRLAEPDYVYDDLILVVDYLTAKWLDDPKMCDYLRPKTIFGPENFSEYFQKAQVWHRKGRPSCIGGKWQHDVMHVPSADYEIPDGWRG